MALGGASPVAIARERKTIPLTQDTRNSIEVSELTKRYGSRNTGVLAVDHVSFAVRRGEVFGFLGPNGAGKTTTQRMLTTLLEPTGGQILIDGHDLADDAYPARRQMGLVPEESNVYDELTAWGNLMFTAKLYRVPRRERAGRAQELLDRLLAIENRLGRKRGQGWGSRCIDLDLLLYGEEVIKTEHLQVPHKRMHEREFVLRGLAEIAPEVKHPVLGKTARQMRQEVLKKDKGTNQKE